MPTRTSTSIIEIDLHRLGHNLMTMQRMVGSETALCCVVKADAYGLGAIRIAQRMQASGVQMLAVYTPEQAEELVAAGVTTTILILMPLRGLDRLNVLYRPLVAGRLHCVVHDARHLEDLQRLGDQYGCVVPVHLEIDTGMSRGGLAPDDAAAIVSDIAGSRRIRLAGLFTHFAEADASDESVTDRQYDRFITFVKGVEPLVPPDCVLHAANTAAALRHRMFHLDMVRIGLAWAGYTPEGLPDGATHPLGAELRGILRWCSKIVHLKQVSAGTTVGYGRTWVADRDTRLALIPVGYADGYPLALSNRGIVRIRAGGQWYNAPVVGRVSMDQITVDITDIPPASLEVGTRVELFSTDASASNFLPKLASLAGTQVYDLMCGLSPRIPRVYRCSRTPRPASQMPTETNPIPVPTP